MNSDKAVAAEVTIIFKFFCLFKVLYFLID